MKSLIDIAMAGHDIDFEMPEYLVRVGGSTSDRRARVCVCVRNVIVQLMEHAWMPILDWVFRVDSVSFADGGICRTSCASRWSGFGRRRTACKST